MALSSEEMTERRDAKARLKEMSERLANHWESVKTNNAHPMLVNTQTNELSADELEAIRTYSAVVTALNSFDR